jgi:hypothetical protein
MSLCLDPQHCFTISLSFLGKDKFSLSPWLIAYLGQDTENYQGFKTRITVKTKLLSKYQFISVAKEVKCNLEAGPTQIDLQLR